MNFIYRNIVVYLSIALLTGGVSNVLSQELSKALIQKIEKQRNARIMFYNCENLFDYIDDTLKRDEEFLPEGDRYWSKTKYYKKLNSISKVITAVGGWSPPEIVGLCEIENRKVLHDLTKNSPLYSFDYKIIHQESPDKRGIDVALLYQPNKYFPIKNRFIQINFPDKPEKKTRDILYSKGVFVKGDTIHLFVNHWPSRWGGQLESEDYRLFVAKVLKQHTDSILKANPNSNILIMGDFNDDPVNKSISEVLSAKLFVDEVDRSKLYNISYIKTKSQSEGTHKHQGSWSLLDQFILSGSLLDKDNKLKNENITIFNADFLLESDDSYLGFKPFRTFVGFTYNGGFSDHLPVFIDLNHYEN